jgi:hypothetical protein
MKSLLPLACTTLTLLAALCSRAASAPYEHGKFKGRIAYSAEGNHNDADDWAASPVALAILAAHGAQDRLVHFDYNCSMTATDPEWEKTHAASVLGAAHRYGFATSVFHDCRKNVEAAVASIARAVDASSADNPCFKHTKRSVIELGLDDVQLRRADGGENAWRALPLVKDGKVHENWAQIPWGSFGVDGDSLRTDSDEKGMGLLLYRAERFGNCQLRVVFKTRDAKSNAGVFVRMDDGILAKTGEKTTPVRRNPDGKLAKEELQKLMDASSQELGPWYAVHHGYEVQICDTGDAFHRTGAIYSLAKAASLPKGEGEWRTMIITLQGDLVLVDVDGRRVTTFDPGAKDVPPARNWTEPRREPRRPQVGYIGLQNHDPGDVVWFKEISVRPLRE